MSDVRAATIAIEPTTGLAAPRPYAPSWIHSLNDAVDRLPGPRWIAIVGIGLVGMLLQHAQLWSTGRVEIGTPDRVQVYWGLVIGAVAWLPGYLERGARAIFERFRPALDVSPEAADRLGYELTIIPARGSAVITALAALVTGSSFIADPEGTSTAGLPPLMLVLAFAIQVFVTAILFQVFYRLLRQLRLVRRILERHVEVDVFRPGPLHAIAALTARPGAILTLLLSSTVVMVPITSDPVALLVAWGPLLFTPPLVAIVAFVAPLTGAHSRLEEQKERLQDTNERRIRGLLLDLNRDVEARDLAQVDAYNKALAALLVERDILAKLPTWPWSTATLRGFFSTILLPLTLFLLQQVLSRLLQSQA